MNVLKRFLCLVCVVIGLFVTTKARATEYNLPSKASVTLRRDHFELRFMWETKEPNFPPGTAAEFQVVIDPKCFAEPVGGKDDSDKAPKNYYLPPEADPYTDVWNYWVPPFYQIGGIMEERCGGLGPFNKYGADFYQIIKGVTEKDAANFAVGVHNAHALKQGEPYYFVYPLQVPLRKECVDAANDNDPKNDPNEGFAVVSMAHFSSTCEMSYAFFCGGMGGVLISVQGGLPGQVFCAIADNIQATYYCPELIGFDGGFGIPGCNGPNAATQIWLNRLCVPTEEVSNFTPGVDTKSLHTTCIDKDNDGWFATQSSPMFGSNVGDCNDDPKKGGKSVHPDAPISCTIGADNDCNGQTDCDEASCSLSMACDSFSCPSGDGSYCGDPNLGQTVGALYKCTAGVYEFISDCNNLGCIKNMAGTPDICSQGSDPCQNVTCISPPNPQCQNSSGTCVGGFCEYSFKPQGTVCNDGNACTSNDICDAFGNCFGSGNCEVCDGIDNDGNGLIDDGISGCWTTIYRYQDPVTKARCWNKTDAGPPNACSSYVKEIEAFIVRATPMPNTFQGVQCSHLTDHIIVPVGSADHNALLASNYDCSLNLGYFYYPGTGPTSGTTEWNKTCPMYRFKDPLQVLDDGHIFTIYDNTGGITCEGYKADVLTNQFCFPSPPQGC